MSQDVMQECWKSCVPVQLRLADCEVTAVEQPPVLYFLVPRHSYLLSLLPRALPFLQHVLPPGEDTPWVEHRSLPLKWNVPAGVLFDLLVGQGELPWSLTLHLRGYPSSVLPAYEGEAALRGSLLNSLKEAAFICRGSSLRVMEMSPGAQEDLYRSVQQQDLPLYRSVLQSLQLAPVARSGRQPAIPLRLFVRAGGRGYLSSYEDIAYTSRLVECQRPDGSLVTLRHALLPLVAEYVAPGPAPAAGVSPAPPSPAPPPAAAAAAAESAAAAVGELALAEPIAEGGGVAAAAAERGAVAGGGEEEGLVDGESGSQRTGASLNQQQGHGSQEGSRRGLEAGSTTGGAVGNEPLQQQESGASVLPGGPERLLREVLVCGVSPPLESPVAWVHANMHAADLFLYVVVHVSNA